MHLSAVPLKICLLSTRNASFEMCPINGPTRLKNVNVEELEEEEYRNSSDCK
jgi:hypothetical protein